MSVDFISLGSVSPWYSKIASPVERGLQGWWTFDTDISRIGFNRAPGGADARIIGTPLVTANCARFTGNSAYLQTEVPDSDEMTLIALCRTVAAPTGLSDGAMFVGAYQGLPIAPGFTGTSVGANLYAVSATHVTASSARSDGATGILPGTTTVASVPTTWALRAMRTSSAGVTKAFDLTAGVSVTGSAPTQRVLNGNKLRIGSATTLMSGQSDISSVVIATAAWTDSEIALVAALMRKRAARLGITV